MRHWLLLCAVFGFFYTASVAVAQDGLFGLKNTFDSEDDEPASELPPLPEVEEDPEDFSDTSLPRGGQQGYAMAFPDLPPSRLCTKRDILGMWRLEMVYESPPADELNDFTYYPFQYTLFNRDSTYFWYRSEEAGSSETAILRQMQQGQPNVLEQFVMHKSGVLYLYKDGEAINSLACFIVANPVEPFREGQMLFMPPPERADVRMVKVFDRVYSAPKQNNKKRKKRNRRRR